MIIVDVETTGTEPHKHSLVSIGALDFYNPENEFYVECRIWEGAHIMEDAMRINGYTETELRDEKRMTEAEAVAEFIRWASQCRERTIAGQSPSFDRDFLKAAAGRAGLNWTFAQRTIDMHSVAYFHVLKHGIKPPTVNGHSALDSDAIAKYCGIPAEVRPHIAINGARIEAEMFSRLIHDEALYPQYKKYPVPWVTD